MPMMILERSLELPPVANGKGLFQHLEKACAELLTNGEVPVRVVITSASKSAYHCELGVITGSLISTDSIFEFRRRPAENTQKFSVVLLIPTGIGTEIGGHAGDAGPVARILGEAVDTLVLHPNVVNASDLNEMPSNALYVEGSVVTRLLMGTLGLQPVRSNRVLVIIDAHQDEIFVNAAVNTVGGARAAYGLSCPEVVMLDPPIRLHTCFSRSGRAGGRVEGLEGLFRVLDERREHFDAVALSSVINVPHEFHQGYFDAEGEMVNPWGGVEAMLTHALSSVFNVPTAHSPMFESRAIANMDPGIVDPRMAAEAVSTTFLHCVLKGLHRAPKIVTDPIAMWHPSVFTAADVSCLVIPDACIGLPTLAALEQGIKVIAVRENRNLMRNDLSTLPWAAGQFFSVDNYWEAIGVLMSLKAGVAPESVRRPLAHTKQTHTGSAIEQSAEAIQ